MNRSIPSGFELLIEEIKRRGIKCPSIPKTIVFKAQHGNTIHFLSQYTLPIIPRINVSLLDNKKHFKQLLRYYHVPYVLESKTFFSDDWSEALTYARDKLRFPVVCKPQLGCSMDRVYINIRNESELIDIWKENYAGHRNEQVIVEKYLPSVSDYRFFCFREHQNAVLCRQAPFIIGDGFSSLVELIQNENIHRSCQNVFLLPLQIDGPDVKRVLSHQGVLPNSIIPKSKKIFLSYGADANRGGLCEVVDLDTIHPEYWNLVNRVWAIFPSMPYFSLDILSTDITFPLGANCTAINESHVGADATPLLYPSKGKPVNLFSHFVDLLFPETKGC